MLKPGPAKKLTIYVDETDRIHGKPVYETVIDVLHQRGIAGASVFRGLAGYGSTGKIHTAKILELSTTLPVRIEAIDTDEAIRSVLPEVTSIVEKGLIELNDTVVIRSGSRNAG